MPAKLERCVEEVMGQGRSKESAYAICNAAMGGKAKPFGVDKALWDKAVKLTGGKVNGQETSQDVQQLHDSARMMHDSAVVNGAECNCDFSATKAGTSEGATLGHQTQGHETGGAGGVSLGGDLRRGAGTSARNEFDFVNKRLSVGNLKRGERRLLEARAENLAKEIFGVGKTVKEGGADALRNQDIHDTAKATHDMAIDNGATCNCDSVVAAQAVENALKAISETADELIVGNYIVLFGGRDLTAFGAVGNPTPVRKNADGSAGEFFTKATELESNYTAIGRLPEDWEHGQDVEDGMPKRDDVLGYVDWATKAVDEQGVFVQRVLNKRNKYVQWLKDLITAGLVGTSSEAVETAVKVKASGEIETWPLKRDTLTVKPMDWRNTKEFGGNVLAAVKALGLIPDGKQAGQPAPYGASVDNSPKEKAMHDVFELQGKFYVYEVDANGEATGDPVAGPFDIADQAKAEMMKMDAGGNQPPAGQAVESPKPQRVKGAKIMPTKTVDEVIVELSARVKAAEAKLAAPPIFNGRASEPAEPRQEWPYRERGLGDQLADIKAFTTRSEVVNSHNRLKTVADSYNKATGLNEAVGSEGEFLLQPNFTTGIVQLLHEEGPFTKAVRRLPVGEGSNGGVIYGVVNETSRATGSRWGGIQGYRLNEAVAATPTKPAFREIVWRLKKYGVALYATDELLTDSAQLTTILREGASEEIKFMANDDVLRGAGIGGPTGVLNSPALVTQDKVTNQDAATVKYENIVAMWQRVLTKARNNGSWYINSEVEPELDMMAMLAGTAALEPRYVTYDAAGVMKIKGRPVVVNEFSSALGAVGDIMFGDFSDYLYWEKGSEQFETSIHVAFTTFEQVFRVHYRLDGKTASNSPITPYKATSGRTQSSFVTLAARS